MDKDDKNKLIDIAVVTGKSVGMTLVAAACGRALLPAFYKRQWHEQRNSRQYRKALEDAGVAIDFGVKITRKDTKPQVYSLTGASWSIGCDKWELAYHLAKHGSCLYYDGNVKAEIVR